MQNSFRDQASSFGIFNFDRLAILGNWNLHSPEKTRRSTGDKSSALIERLINGAEDTIITARFAYLAFSSEMRDFFTEMSTADCKSLWQHEETDGHCGGWWYAFAANKSEMISTRNENLHMPHVNSVSTSHNEIYWFAP